MSGDASLVWAAYAAGIASLSGISSQNLGANQVFAVAPTNSFSIPVVPYVNQLYQNWAVYQFASVVPEPGIVVFTPSGQTYDAAYTLYMDNILFTVPNDPAVQAEINTNQAELNSTRAEIRVLAREMASDYNSDCPNSICYYNGVSTTLQDYESLFYPDLLEDIKTIAQLTAVQTELQDEYIGTAQLSLLHTWQAALGLGNVANASEPNYNFGVLQTTSGTIVSVASGAETSVTVPNTYTPSYGIGGNFNSVAQQWISTFPSSYPASSTAYNAGASTFSISNLTSAGNNWSQYGYSSATQSSGSNGWIFWSTAQSTTTTNTNNVVDISQSQFSSGITVSAWGIGKFPVSYGLWYHGNILATWPKLAASAPNSTASDISHQITSVVLGYGIQLTFTLSTSAYSSFTQAISSAKSSSGYISIFGFLYGNSGSDYTSTYNSWSSIQTTDSTQTIVLKAQNVKVPQVLGTVITTITG